MANKLIAAQATMNVAFGGAQDGVPTAYGTAVNMQCNLKSWDIKLGHSTVDLAAVCDTEQQLQVVRTNGTISCVSFVPSTGVQFKAYNGYYAQFVITPVSGGTAQTYNGVLTNWSYSGNANGEQTESFDIIIGTNGV